MTEFRWLYEFSENLQRVMHDAGFTQKRLAIETGLSEAAISNYINGTKIPKATTLINLAYALECSVDDLIDFGSQIDF